MNEDTHSELREMIGLHVIDQLEDADRDAMVAHQKGCAACRVEEAQLRGVVAILNLVDPAAIDREPSPHTTTTTRARPAQRGRAGRGSPFHDQ